MKFYRVIMMMLFMGWSTNAISSIWSEITATETYTNSGVVGLRHTYNIFAWDEDDSTVNPCYRDTSCHIWIGIVNTRYGTSSAVYTEYWSALATSNRWISNAATIGELGTAFKANAGLPKTGTIVRNTSYTWGVVEDCVGIFYKNDFYSSGTYMGGTLLPNSICGQAPTPYGYCSFVEDTINLDHGTLTQSQLEGHETSLNVTMSCTYDTTVGIHALSGDNLPLRDDGSLYSEIYINDKLGSDGLSMSAAAGDQVITFKSRLRTNGTVSAGEFSASTVAVISLE